MNYPKLSLPNSFQLLYKIQHQKKTYGGPTPEKSVLLSRSESLNFLFLASDNWISGLQQQSLPHLHRTHLCIDK